MSEPNFCPRCGSALELKTGAFGEFLGCSKYPKCHYTIHQQADPESPVKAAEHEAAADKLKLTYEFAEAVGGFTKAMQWIKVASAAHASLQKLPKTGKTK